MLPKCRHWYLSMGYHCHEDARVPILHHLKEARREIGRGREMAVEGSIGRAHHRALMLIIAAFR